MNVLWLARTIPDQLDDGGRIYTYKLAEALSETSAKITLMGMKDSSQQQATVNKSFTGENLVKTHAVKGALGNNLSFLFSTLPMAGVKFGTRAYKKELSKILAEKTWDAVILDQYSMVWALPILRASGFQGVKVHVALDFETQVTADIAAEYKGNPIKALMLSLNAHRTALAEVKLANECDIVVALTQKDAESFRYLNKMLKFVIAPPGYSRKTVAARQMSGDLPRRVITIGSLEWIAKRLNLLEFIKAADEILYENGIEFLVIGRVPDDFAPMIPSNLQATRFLGFVEDPKVEMLNARLGLVLDRIGGGFKLKILDYIFNRVPILGFEQALDILPPEVKNYTLSELDTKALVNRIVLEIDQIDRLDDLQNGAYATASGRYDWQRNGQLLYEAIHNARRI